MHIPSTELFGDLDEQGDHLLGTLRLEPDDEPIRRGAASRANSVRFDESALHGANFGHGGRHSGDFGPGRPSSGMGGHQMMERTYSHKSDGRHSSAGHSVHSVHSGISGRTSSLGLDTNFMIGGREDDSPLDVPEPPAVYYILGSPPSIIRCWLTTNWTSEGLLYAVVCTGSQKSTVEYSLLKELDLVNRIHRDVDGVHRITLPVFLAEARVVQANSRSTSPAPQLPSITASFEVTGMDQPEVPPEAKGIRVCIGSHTLRMHSADILLSQNLMTLYGSDRDKLSIPFVRPENDSVFKYLTTTHVLPSKPKLNAAAPEFVTGERLVKESAAQPVRDQGMSEVKPAENGTEGKVSSTAVTPISQPSKPVASFNTTSENDEKQQQQQQQQQPVEPSQPEPVQPLKKESSTTSATTTTEPVRRETTAAAAIRTPWRQTAAGLGDGTPLSGYQPAARPRSMKVLRPNKSSSSSTTRTGAAYEPAPPLRNGVSNSNGPNDQRRKGQEGGSSGSGNTVTWGPKRSVSTPAVGNFGDSGEVGKQEGLTAGTVGIKIPPAPRTANNPLGSATAFSWIATPAQPSTKANGSAAAAE